MGKYIGIKLSGKISESELILNSDGSVYHLRLLPEHIADNVILVGDPARVEIISKRFDRVNFKTYNREFITHTGEFNNKRITVIATGIGTDNIDIVLNELDAAININLKDRLVKDEKKSLNIVRIGTSGALQKDIPIDSFVVSSYSLGFDGLLHFYDGWDKLSQKEITEAFILHSDWKKDLAKPYIIKGSDELLNKIGNGIKKGITATASGFYAPQGRKLRANLSIPHLNQILTTFRYNGNQITNLEMETSALYGLGQLLGHKTCTICAIIANRIIKQYSKDYKKTVDRLIDHVLQKLTS